MAGHGKILVHGAPRTTIDVDLFIQALIAASQESGPAETKGSPVLEVAQ
ncbi:hypothetical protein [Parafrankia sp. BMG5.11]|nr:hypothetical protein [Parafrankia sp. BMG5.11]